VTRRIALSVLLLSLALPACRGARAQLVGQWKTEATPERTLDLFEDGTYSLRLSGKGLGFVSEILGPEKGLWKVEKGRLILTRSDKEGGEHTYAGLSSELKRDSVVLAQDRWKRVSAN
jgi:hypothetical protein